MKIFLIFLVIWLYLNMVSLLILIYFAEHEPMAKIPDIEDNWVR